MRDLFIQRTGHGSGDQIDLPARTVDLKITKRGIRVEENCMYSLAY